MLGGLVFLPHIYEYKDNSEAVLNYILENYKIDGIECYYTTFSKEQHESILKVCNKNSLYVSGGSDFHGKSKPDVNVGIGYGNLQIPTNILDNWISKIKLFEFDIK